MRKLKWRLRRLWTKPAIFRFTSSTLDDYAGLQHHIRVLRWDRFRRHSDYVVTLDLKTGDRPWEKVTLVGTESKDEKGRLVVSFEIPIPPEDENVPFYLDDVLGMRSSRYYEGTE